jgi:hypothetical protein
VNASWPHAFDGVSRNIPPGNARAAAMTILNTPWVTSTAGISAA